MDPISAILGLFGGISSFLGGQKASKSQQSALKLQQNLAQQQAQRYNSVLPGYQNILSYLSGRAGLGSGPDLVGPQMTQQIQAEQNPAPSAHDIALNHLLGIPIPPTPGQQLNAGHVPAQTQGLPPGTSPQMYQQQPAPRQRQASNSPFGYIGGVGDANGVPSPQAPKVAGAPAPQVGPYGVPAISPHMAARLALLHPAAAPTPAAAVMPHPAAPLAAPQASIAPVARPPVAAPAAAPLKPTAPAPTPMVTPKPGMDPLTQLAQQRAQQMGPAAPVNSPLPKPAVPAPVISPLQQQRQQAATQTAANLQPGQVAPRAALPVPAPAPQVAAAPAHPVAPAPAPQVGPYGAPAASPLQQQRQQAAQQTAATLQPGQVAPRNAAPLQAPAPVAPPAQTASSPLIPTHAPAPAPAPAAPAAPAPAASTGSAYHYVNGVLTPYQPGQQQMAPNQNQLDALNQKRATVGLPPVPQTFTPNPAGGAPIPPGGQAAGPIGNPGPSGQAAGPLPNNPFLGQGQQIGSVSNSDLGIYNLNQQDRLRLAAAQDDIDRQAQMHQQQLSFVLGHQGLMDSGVAAAAQARNQADALGQYSNYRRDLAANAGNEQDQRVINYLNALAPAFGFAPQAQQGAQSVSYQQNQLAQQNGSNLGNIAQYLQYLLGTQGSGARNTSEGFGSKAGLNILNDPNLLVNNDVHTIWGP